jgi:arylsulfatase A-like enzyme
MLRLPLVGAIALFSLTLSPRALLAQAPNVLLIVADDVGVDSVGCYGLGSSPPPTPNVDALAAGGVRFTNAQACPTCSPTRASILTGRHGFRTGIGVALGGGSTGLATSETLLPEILRPAGVRTGLIGKWHLGDDAGALTPTNEGFDVFTGAMQGAVANYYAWPKVENGVVATSTTYATTDCVDEALGFVAGTPAGQPWFCMLSFHAGHTPLHAPPAALHTQNLAGLDPTTTPFPFYKAMVEAMDAEIGRMLAALPPSVRANTNVVFVGDNGTAPLVVQAPFDPTRSKGTIYQGGVRVPLIWNGPAVAGAPRVEASLVHAVDLFATLAAVQGVTASTAVPSTTTLDAVDARPLLAASPQPVRTTSYSQAFTGTTAMSAPGDSEGIRDQRFELLRFVRPNGSVREEAYDLQNDPFELVDLLQQPLSATASAALTSLRRELAKLRGYAFAGSIGSSCTGAGVTPILAVVSGSAPTVGAPFTLRVTGLVPATVGTLSALGFSDAVWAGVPLPLDLGAIGATGCSLWIAPDVIGNLTTTATAALFPIVLPNNPAIVGAELFAQAFPLQPGANGIDLLASNAVVAVVGP